MQSQWFTQLFRVSRRWWAGKSIKAEWTISLSPPTRRISKKAGLRRRLHKNYSSASGSTLCRALSLRCHHQQQGPRGILPPRDRDHRRPDHRWFRRYERAVLPDPGVDSSLKCSYRSLAYGSMPTRPTNSCTRWPETIKDGKGSPKLINDEFEIPWFMSNGIVKHEALDYAMSGCSESRLPNRETHKTGNGGINYGAVMEMMLRDGRIKIYKDEQFGLRTVTRGTSRLTTKCGMHSSCSSRTSSAHHDSELHCGRAKAQVYRCTARLHAAQSVHGARKGSSHPRDYIQDPGRILYRWAWRVCDLH